ncbi:EamA family transporter [Chloroflexi bacterium TSY]|nr:EamA family transporter [Chloroflexi bacterium TSY]
MFTTYEVWLGLCLYGFSSFIWLWVLTKAPLSYAYPILALTFPLVVALSVLLFGETVSPMRWFGICIIIAGVSLLAKS